MNELIIRGICEADNRIKNFAAKEKGASDMVAVIVLIVIIIAVAALFKDKLLGIVSDVMDKLTNATQ